MLYRKIPKTGDALSILGFGCMRLPQKEGRIDAKRAIGQICSAIDYGVNYLDTAWPYHGGESERFLGEHLPKAYRDKVRIATKLPSWMIRSRADMDTYLNLQLEKLKTDHIDYYLAHALNGHHWANLTRLGVTDFLNQALRDGRIRNAGFSFHGTLSDFKQIVDAYDWTFCQIQYNYLDEELQAGTQGLQYAAAKDLGIIVMEPLRGGSLAAPEPPPDIATIWNTAETRRTPAAWALQWVWDHPEVTCVLSGMNDETQVTENLAEAAKAHPGALSAGDHDVIRRVAAKYREIMRVGCTGCGYCKPCPEGVDIPNCFDLYNNLKMFGKVEEAKFGYAIRLSGILSGAPGYASQCIQCGDCLEKCPQGIAIPDILQEVAAEMEDADLDSRVATARKFLNME